jgi:hypothetical protein
MAVDLFIFCSKLHRETLFSVRPLDVSKDLLFRGFPGVELEDPIVLAFPGLSKHLGPTHFQLSHPKKLVSPSQILTLQQPYT